VISFIAEFKSASPILKSFGNPIPDCAPLDVGIPAWITLTAESFISGYHITVLFNNNSHDESIPAG